MRTTTSKTFTRMRNRQSSPVKASLALNVGAQSYSATVFPDDLCHRLGLARYLHSYMPFPVNLVANPVESKLCFFWRCANLGIIGIVRFARRIDYPHRELKLMELSHPFVITCYFYCVVHRYQPSLSQLFAPYLNRPVFANFARYTSCMRVLGID